MFIQNLDNLSPEITLYYKGNESHISLVSGILTIFYYLTLIGFAAYFSLDLINKKNPKTFYSNSFTEDSGSYTFNSSSFFHFINIVEENRKSIKI